MRGQDAAAIDWRSVSLLGIDVGYSESRATTGIASYCFGEPLDLRCVRFLPDERHAALNDGRIYDAIAIDGPLVPSGNAGLLRSCERILSRGKIGARCKAGFSHFGQGANLRAAAATIAGENSQKRKLNAPTVEAFPNAFLGVMLDDAAYLNLPRPIPRGRKSDLFYARAVRDTCFARLFELLGWHDDLLKGDVSRWGLPSGRIAHEYRAAIVCILTAACALSGAAEYVGDQAGGYICLPPRSLWADWACKALSES